MHFSQSTKTPFIGKIILVIPETYFIVLDNCPDSPLKVGPGEIYDVTVEGVVVVIGFDFSYIIAFECVDI